jgi:hypothetical protein
MLLAGVFVAFTLQNILNHNLFLEQFGEKAFQYGEINLAAQQPLHCPIKTD